MERISIAKVLKPQGLKGELKCLPLTEKKEVFENLKFVFCNNEKLEVVASVFRFDFAYITLKGVDSIEKAESFRNKTFFISMEDFGELGEDTYFIDELIGMTCYTEEGEKIGEVLGIENYGATDILQIKDKWATYLVPFVGKIFLDVDVENKKIIVNKQNYEDNKV
jgi:16S rRNA processing protein RimM